MVGLVRVPLTKCVVHTPAWATTVRPTTHDAAITDSLVGEAAHRKDSKEHKVGWPARLATNGTMYTLSTHTQSREALHRRM